MTLPADVFLKVFYAEPDMDTLSGGKRTFQVMFVLNVVVVSFEGKCLLVEAFQLHPQLHPKFEAQLKVLK